MPGARWFPGAGLNYAENLLAGKPDDRLAIQHASELRELDSLTWGELARAGRRARPPALRELGVGPGDRVVAYVPNVARGGDRLPRHRVDRRDLVELLARLRRPLGRRPVRPDRAEGALLRRRLPLQRPGLRPPRRRRRPARRDADGRAHRRRPLPRPRARHSRGCATRSLWDDLLASGAGRRARLRAGAVRPSPLGPLLLRAPRGCRRRSSRATAGSCSSS